MTLELDPDLDLRIDRVIRAPRARVWKAWTDPLDLAHWWLPSPTQCRVDRLDVVPGGAFVTSMSDDGMTVKPVATPAPVQVAAPVAQAPAKPKQPPVEVKPVDIAKVAQQLESFLKRVSRELEFHVDDASGRVVCSVRDAQTGDLIRQIPNEEVLRLAELAHDETIVLVNEKA